LAAVQTLVVACRSGELGRTCCHGGWPGLPPLPMPLSATAPLPTPPYRYRRHHWHHRGGIDCQLHARARFIQHTAFIHHTRSASSLRAGTTASEVYIYISTVDRYNNIIIFYIAVVARDKQKSAVQYDNCTIVVSFFHYSLTASGFVVGRPQRQPSDRNNIILLSRQTIHTTTNTTHLPDNCRIIGSATNEVNQGLYTRASRRRPFH